MNKNTPFIYGMGGLAVLLILKNAGKVTNYSGNTDKTFIDTIKPLTIALQARTGANYRYPIVQSALESDFGRSGLARKANNLFGIKSTSAWKQSGGAIYTAETIEENVFGVPYTTYAEFRRYNSWNESINDWWGLLNSLERYRKVVVACKNGTFQDFSGGLQVAGYATDSNYASKLNKLYYELLPLM